MRPQVLTIAGFDPSGGAGLLADVKTFEQLGCLGMSVMTANTIQTEDDFVSPGWLSEDRILQQLSHLLDRYDFSYAKIGLVQSFELLERIKNILIEARIKIIWDPVLSTSTGFDFSHDLVNVRKALLGCYLVTPNEPELERIKTYMSFEDMILTTNVLHKGGHATQKGIDLLYYDGKRSKFLPGVELDSEIHGSGCIFSAAITSYLTIGLELIEAIQMAKIYVEERLANKQGKLAYHS